jgi:WD40-like Beta Propeller Repeat
MRFSQLWTLLCTATLWAAPGPNAASKPPYDVGPTVSPQLFAENIVSTEDDEVGGTFSPDGTEFYFAKLDQYTNFPHLGLICVTRYRDGKWSKPEVVSFSGQYLDATPRFSPDGKAMYFSSNRPVPDSKARPWRVWMVERQGTGWGEPKPLPAPVNAPERAWNFGASVTKDGTIYFSSSRASDGLLHIYRSHPDNGRYSEPEMLGPEINSAFYETDPFVSPDEHLLIFASAGTGPPSNGNRKDAVMGEGVLYSRGDLYVSVNQNGKWSLAKHLEHGINSFGDEGAPSLTPDGKYLFFTSERSPFTVPMRPKLTYVKLEEMLHSILNGHGNVYFISVDALELGKGGQP